jgi:hypothetical protein
MPKEDDVELEDFNDKLEDAEDEQFSDTDTEYEEDLDAGEAFAEERAASEFDDE